MKPAILHRIRLVTAVNSNLNNDAMNTLGGEIFETHVESLVGAGAGSLNVGVYKPSFLTNKKNQPRRTQSDVVNFELLAAIVSHDIPDQTCGQLRFFGCHQILQILEVL